MRSGFTQVLTKAMCLSLAGGTAARVPGQRPRPSFPGRKVRAIAVSGRHPACSGSHAADALFRTGPDVASDDASPASPGFNLVTKKP